MIKIQIGKKEYKLPERWDELSTGQYAKVAEALCSNALPQEKRRKILKAFLWHQLNWRLALQLWRVTDSSKPAKDWMSRLADWVLGGVLDHDDLGLLLVQVDWCFDTTKIFSQRIPFVKFMGRKYWGPTDRLGNLAFWEWVKADAAYIDFLKSNDEQHLNQLVATIYRPERPNFNPEDPDHGHDRRIDYADHSSMLWRPLIAQWPIGTRLGIFLFYAACRELLISQYDEVFVSDSKGSNKNINAQTVWLQVLRQLAVGLDKYDSVARTQVSLVLFEMRERIKEQEELKANSPV